MKLSKRALQEQETYKLLTMPDYTGGLLAYTIQYKKRPPHGTADKNMLKALRMSPWHNSSDDWARLHTCEMFLRSR